MSTDFSCLVLSVVRRIPPGRVATYGYVAEMAGHPRGPRVPGHLRHVAVSSDAPRGDPTDDRQDETGEIRAHRRTLRAAAAGDSSASVPTLHRQHRLFIVSTDSSSSVPTRHRQHR